LVKPDKNLQIYLRKAVPEDIPSFVTMESADKTAPFIIPYSLEKHWVEIEKPDIIYLSILADHKIVGFIIININQVSSNVEFRRIVVASKGQGIGQAAISKMEQYCLTELGCRRIWLDVFEFNETGRYLYEKMGYQYFKPAAYDDKKLLYYEKLLCSRSN
jgi:RimJ/RimL family protein N-acetyltransferase